MENTTITNMKNSFQDGVDSIYNAIVGQGTTPGGRTPAQIVNGIGALATAKFEAGKSYAITTTTAIAISLTAGGNTWNGGCIISITPDGNLRFKYESRNDNSRPIAYALTSGEIFACCTKRGGLTRSAGYTNFTDLVGSSDITTTESDNDRYNYFYIHNNPNLTGKKILKQWVSKSNVVDTFTEVLQAGQVAIISADDRVSPTITNVKITHYAYGHSNITSTQTKNDDNDMRLYIVIAKDDEVGSFFMRCGGTSWGAGGYVILG